MNPQTYESSGYLIDGFEGIDHHFTNIEIIKNTVETTANIEIIVLFIKLKPHLDRTIKRIVE